MSAAIDRYALVNARGVTLNGRPARISGAKLDYAIVHDDDGRRAEWAWSTAARIVANGGAFKL